MQVKSNPLCLSSLLWGISWDTHLPCIIDSYSFEASNFDEFNEFKNNPANFVITSDTSNDSFLKEYLIKSKENYLRYFNDFFAFKFNNRIIGFAICEVSDWSNYYVRYFFILPEHRSNNLTVKFTIILEAILKDYPLDKITCDVAANNLPQISRLSNAGFICTGNSQSERFGVLLKLTKFIKENSLRTYNSLYSQSFRNEIKSEKMIFSDNQNRRVL